MSSLDTAVHHSDNPRVRAILGIVALVTSCVVTAAAVARYPPTYLLGFAGLIAAVMIARWNRGVLTGIVVLLLLNGMPFVSTVTGSERGANALNDVLFVALLAFLAVCALTGTRTSAQRRLAVRASMWGACYLTWWGFKVLAGSPGVPVLPAISYGRDFMGFAILFPLALWALPRPKHLAGLAIVLGAGAALFSVGQILDQVIHTTLPSLIHISKATEFEGITRINAPMTDLLIAAFPMSFAAMLIGPKTWRRPAVLLTVLTGAANALSFTRAIYASELIAIFAISTIWFRGTAWQHRRVRRAFIGGIAAGVAAVAVAGGTLSTNANQPSPAQAIVSRAALGFSNVENQSGNVGYRLGKARIELQTLGDHWLTGLGFLNPAYRYFSDLRQGSIRDDDLGSLSVVMTMGVVGLLLAYMPPLAGLIYLLRRRRGSIQYGGAMYLGAAIAGSITLGAISTVSGLLVLATMLALCLNWTAERSP